MCRPATCASAQAVAVGAFATIRSDWDRVTGVSDFMGPRTQQVADRRGDGTRTGAGRRDPARAGVTDARSARPIGFLRRIGPRAAWVVVALLWVSAIGVRSLGAAGLTRSQDAPAEMTKSSMSGVFTAPQAESGQGVYESTCLGGCHSLSSHRGVAFRKRWEGHPVFELFQLISEEMPKDDPGSLSPEQSLQLVAYLLKLNGVPAGTEALSTDPAALKKIKIDLPPAVPSSYR
jgi:hypothetical protein